jgi:hypothetical protein
MYLQLGVVLNEQWVKYEMKMHINRLKKRELKGESLSRGQGAAAATSSSGADSQEMEYDAPSASVLGPAIIERSTVNDLRDLKEWLKDKSYLLRCTRDKVIPKPGVFIPSKAPRGFIIAEGEDYAVAKCNLIYEAGTQMNGGHFPPESDNAGGYLIDPVSQTHTHEHAHMHIYMRICMIVSDRVDCSHAKLTLR